MQNIKILNGIDHIRTRPGMYIGDGIDVTHLLEELLDNALDEVTNGYASVVGLVKDGNVYSVMDNGRGLPVYFDREYDQDIAVLLFTVLFSGGKFNEDNYKVRIGAHGVGLAVVNALSKKLIITIYHETKNILESMKRLEIKGVDKKELKKYELVKFEYVFKNGELDDKVIEYINGNKPFSTAVTFEPDEQYFQSIKYNKTFIEHRLKIASIFTGAKILWRENNNDIIIDESLDNYFHKLFNYRKEIFLPLIKFSYKDKKTLEGIDLVLTWNLQDIGINTHASINLLPVKDGAHINSLNNTIINVIDKLKNKKWVFNKTDALVGIRYYCNVYILDPFLEGQTKEKLSNNLSNKNKLIPLMEKVGVYLEKYFKDNPNILDKLLQKFQDYRLSLSAKKTTRNLVGNSNIRGLTSKDSRLKDCTNKDVETTELLICEGESASGSLVQCRDYKRHAILPLKGKTINVVSNDVEKVIKNKEILDIIRSVGVGMKIKDSDKLDLSKIRYGKIILIADADPDGGHILSLLMAAFLKFTPDLVKQGYLYICLPPLYALRNKKEYHAFYSKEELDEFVKNKDISKYELLRYKGLGEMNPEEMKVAAINPKTRKLVQLRYPTNKNQYDEIFELLTSSQARKKLLESGVEYV